MKKQMRFILLFILCFSLLVSIMPVYAADHDSHITVTLNGKELDFDVMPQIIDNRTMVPMRTIFEAMGATVDWDENTQTITVTRDAKVIIMQVGNRVANILGKSLSTDTCPVIIKDHVMVSIRMIAESFGATVEWNDILNRVLVFDWDYIMQDVVVYDEEYMIPDFGRYVGLTYTNSKKIIDDPANGGYILAYTYPNDLGVNKTDIMKDYMRVLEQNGFVHAAHLGVYFDYYDINNKHNYGITASVNDENISLYLLARINN